MKKLLHIALSFFEVDRLWLVVSQRYGGSPIAVIQRQGPIVSLGLLFDAQLGSKKVLICEVEEKDMVEMRA